MSENQIKSGTKTGFVYDAIYLEHKTTPDHPERPERLVEIVKRLKAEGIYSDLLNLKPTPADSDWIKTVHSPEYIERAARAANFVLSRLVNESGGLHRSFVAGSAREPAVLDDYALMADGLIALHAATGDARWLEKLRIVARNTADLSNKGWVTDPAAYGTSNPGHYVRMFQFNQIVWTLGRYLDFLDDAKHYIVPLQDDFLEVVAWSVTVEYL